MELKYKFYIVSFSDSKKYRLTCEAADHNQVLKGIEDELCDYLKKEFPDDDSFAYYVTPKVVEIAWQHRDQYSGYPELDKAAIAQIKQELKTEIEMRDNDTLMDSNAPFNRVPPNTDSIH